MLAGFLVLCSIITVVGGGTLLWYLYLCINC